MGATWTNEHTGDGKGFSPDGNLFVWGTNLGITVNGRTLFCMKDVGIIKNSTNASGGGDGKVDNKVKTYAQAFAKIKDYSKTKTDSAYLWDSEK